MIFPALERIAFLKRLQFLRAAVKFLVVGAGVTGKSLHFYPEKSGAISGTDFLHRFSCSVVNFADLSAVNFSPVVRLKRIERERIDFSRRGADAVGVVFDQEQHRQFFFLGKTNRFEEIALSSGGVADRGNDKIIFAVEFDAPGHAASREKLRAGGRRHAPDVAFGIAVMRRHHAPAAAGFSFRKIFQRQLARGHATTEDQAAIAIVRNNVVARIKLNRNRGQRFVSHSGDMKVAFALAI